MPSSGSVDFSVSRNDIILAALQGLGVAAAGDTSSSSSFTTNSTMMAMLLNMLVKNWSGNADYAPGVKMWSRKTAYLFLQKDQSVYALGPTVSATTSTDKWASSYVTTTIGTSEAAGQTVLTMTDGSIFASGNRIGIELDTGYLQWTTVSGSPSGNDVTIAVALTSAASAGNRVFGYATTAQGRRPLEIYDGCINLRDTNGNDRLIEVINRERYEAISNKNNDATPTQAHYSATLTDGTLYLDSEPVDVTDVLRIVYISPIEDFDAAADTPDYDQNWYLPLVLGLQEQAALPFGKEAQLPAIRLLLYGDNRSLGALTLAKNATPETTDRYYECNA